MVKWTEIGRGGSNIAYKNEENTQVLKIELPHYHEIVGLYKWPKNEDLNDDGTPQIDYFYGRDYTNDVRYENVIIYCNDKLFLCETVTHSLTQIEENASDAEELGALKNIFVEIQSGSFKTPTLNEKELIELVTERSFLELPSHFADSPTRSVRLWEIINPDLPAHIVESELGLGWVAPYLEGVKPSAEEISKALIDIYSKTGRIITDPHPDNFVKTADNKVVCIDVGMALLQLEAEDRFFETKIRRNSEISLGLWQEFGHFYKEGFHSYSVTPTLKALLFIKLNRPDITDVSFLKDSPEIITKLSNAYDEQAKRIAPVDLNVYRDEQKDTPEPKG